MPRIRSLKPEALQHRKVGRLSDAAFRLWIALITQADDDGRLAFDADQFRILIWGYHPDRTAYDVDNCLEEVAKLGLCRIYAVADCLYVDIPSWHDHQKINRARDSILPKFGAKNQVSLNGHGALTEHSRSAHWGSIGSDRSDQIDLPCVSAHGGDGEPPSAPERRAARRLRVDNPPAAAAPSAADSPLAGTVSEFMATVRQADAASREFLPPRGDEQGAG